MTLPRSLVGCAMRFNGLYINVSLLMTTLTGVPVETLQAPSTATGRRQLASCVSSSVEVCSQIPFSLSIYCCTSDSFVTELLCALDHSSSALIGGSVCINLDFVFCCDPVMTVFYPVLVFLDPEPFGCRNPTQCFKINQDDGPSRACRSRICCTRI